MLLPIKATPHQMLRVLLRAIMLNQLYLPKGVYLQEGSNLTLEDFYNVTLYRKRHVIERLFGRLKENKRLAMRFDKLDSTFLSFIAIALAKLYKLFC